MPGVTAADNLRPLFRTVIGLGVAGLLILSVGLVEFFAFEPLGERTGATARVEGVYRYDPDSHQTSGASSTKFSANQEFAAVVDWSSVAASTVVGARWYNSLGTDVGGVDPKPASQMTDADRTIPVKVPEGFHANIPGEYLFVVERFRDGQPVEVLARRYVLVKRQL